jgi:hypothetical protein
MYDQNTVYAKGIDFTQSEVYRPAVRPGFTSWVCIWPIAGKTKEYLLSFVEMRRGSNPVFRPVPLDFYNSMTLPYKYQITLCNGEKDIITENVILHSKDNCRTWTEVGRSCHNAGQAIGFTYESLPGGDILRALSNAYVTFGPDEEQKMIIQRSGDCGNTWTDISTVSSGFFHFPHRLRRLNDGTLILVSPYTESFGPWTAKKTRSVLRSEVLLDSHMTVYVSKDDGASWTGPLYIFQGYNIMEAEFVEMPSGDLFFLESGIFSPPGTPPLRQYLYKTQYGFIPGPVMKSLSGPSPETAVLTAEGILVGTTRGKIYSCSNNMGRTWYPLTNIPVSGYQPMIRQLDDGSFLTAWHYGGDNMFGETDQFVGTHRFILEEKLPAVTTISLDRNRDADGRRYVNSFTAQLKQGQRPMVGSTIRFSVAHRGTDAFLKPDPREQGEHFEMITDSKGQAVLSLEEYDRQRDIHASYKITADFDPGDRENNAGVAPSESDIYFFYGINGVIGEKDPYRLFYALGTLYASAGILGEYPEIEGFVSKFGRKKGFSMNDVAASLDITQERAKKLIDMLCGEFIVKTDGTDITWVFSRFSCELNKVRKIDTSDYFI